MVDEAGAKRGKWRISELLKAVYVDRMAVPKPEAYKDQDVVCDMLIDLMHWCETESIDFDETLTRAARHFDRHRSKRSFLN